MNEFVCGHTVSQAWSHESNVFQVIAFRWRLLKSLRYAHSSSDQQETLTFYTRIGPTCQSFHQIPYIIDGIETSFQPYLLLVVFRV